MALFQKKRAEPAITAHWNRAYEAYCVNDVPICRYHLEQMLQHDPSCADALLILYSFDANRDYLKRLLYCSERLGEYRNSVGAQMNAVFLPGNYTAIPILSTRDVRLADACWNIFSNENDAAREQLITMDASDPIVSAVWARLLVSEERTADAVVHAQTAVKCPAIEFDMRILLSTAYVSLGLNEIAVRALESYRGTSPNENARMLWLYRLGHAHHAAGDVEAARKYWSDIFAIDANYLNVAELLGIDAPELNAASQRIQSDAEWAQIVNSIELNQLATDPDIGDNRV